MRRKIIVVFSTLIVLLYGPAVSKTFGQPIVMDKQKVVYALPYPGLLPDNPLYFFKAVRDRVLDITTRDYIKKAELYLLFSDKRVSMAMALADIGKDKLAVTSFSKGEKYFSQIPPLLETSKKQGVSAPVDLISRLKLSNAKHQEVATELLKKLPQGRGEEVHEILTLNAKIKARLEKL